MATDIAMDVPATAEPESRTRSWTRRIPLVLGVILVVALASGVCAGTSGAGAT